jgi:hypothetical protein
VAYPFDDNSVWQSCVGGSYAFSYGLGWIRSYPRIESKVEAFGYNILDFGRLRELSFHVGLLCECLAPTIALGRAKRI